MEPKILWAEVATCQYSPILSQFTGFLSQVWSDELQKHILTKLRV